MTLILKVLETCRLQGLIPAGSLRICSKKNLRTYESDEVRGINAGASHRDVQIA